jgi:hypothetical protein
VEVWEPGLLVDAVRDRFHDAEGLAGDELTLLRGGPRPLRHLADRLGWDWVGRRLRRLVLLGLVDFETLP